MSNSEKCGHSHIITHYTKTVQQLRSDCTFGITSDKSILIESQVYQSDTNGNQSRMSLPVSGRPRVLKTFVTPSVTVLSLNLLDTSSRLIFPFTTQVT